MKNILAIDTSTEGCSVALQFEGQRYRRFEIRPQEHSQRVLPMVDEVLKEAGVTLTQLDAIAFGRGPGSFTGVRIGVGVAQGLAFGADLPMVGISTLQTMAQGAIRGYNSERIVAAIDARMGEIYTAEYIAKPGPDGALAALVGEEKVVKPELVEYIFDDEDIYDHYDIYGVGTGWETYKTILLEKVEVDELIEFRYPQAEDMLPLADDALANNLQVRAEDAQPVYVRDTVSWKKLPGK